MWVGGLHSLKAHTHCALDLATESGANPLDQVRAYVVNAYQEALVVSGEALLQLVEVPFFLFRGERHINWVVITRW